MHPKPCQTLDDRHQFVIVLLRHCFGRQESRAVMAASTGSPTTANRAHAGMWVVAICFVTIVFDGYDLIVYGAVVPSLLNIQPGISRRGRPGRSAAMPSPAW